MRVSYYKIWAYLVAIICVFPSYASVGGININNILRFLFYLISFTVVGNTTRILKDSVIKIPFVWIFFAIWFLQTCFDSNVYSGVMYLLQTVAFFATIMIVATSEQRFDDLIRALINISMPLCVLGIIEELTSVNFFSMYLGDDNIYSETRMSMSRIYSTFTHPISYGIFLAIIAILIVYMKKKYSEKKYTVNLILILINLCFTVSRSIIVTGLAALVLTYFLYGSNRMTKKKMLLSMAAIGLLFVSPILFPTVLDFFSEIALSVLSTFNSNVSSSELGSAAGNRFDLYAWTLYSLHGHYVFGVGTNSAFRYVIASYAWGKSIKESLENQYLWVFYQHGLIGLISYIVCLINLVLVFIMSLKDKKAVTITKAAFVIVIMYIVMFFTTAESADITTFYVILAIGIVYKYLERENAEYPELYQ